MSRIALAFLAITWAAAAHAQQPESAGAPSCLASIPASALTPVAVHLEASADAPHRQVLPVADTLTLLVAQAIRSAFGGGGGSLPQADAPMHWRQLPADVRVVLHRDGSFTGTMSLTARSYMLLAGGSDTTPNAARLLITDALAALRDAGVRLSWPPAATADSLEFRLGYVWPSPAEDGTIAPLRARFAVPVFMLPVPWERPIAVRRLAPPRYPLESRAGNVQGTLILLFLVDTTGHVVPGTIRDDWPHDKPRLRGDLADHYRAFVAAATRSVAAAEFTPMALGGCVVRQRAQMPFVYELRP